jgi:hypothetical protein
LAQDAVTPTIATIAAPPATAARRRANRDDSMCVSYLYARTAWLHSRHRRGA